MADETTTQFIVGDAALDAAGQEPKRRFFGRKKKREPKITHCENCSAQLHGPYCAVCGQHAIDYRRSLWRLLVDAADSFLDWDTKFLQTSRVLLTRPWKLTQDFNAGRRVRYAHPLRLYLLASIAFFLLAKLVQFSPLNDNRGLRLNPADRAEVDAALGKLVAPESPLSPEQRARVEAARARWAASADPAVQDTRESQRLSRAMLRLPRFADRPNFRPQDAVKLDAALARIEAIGKEPETPDAESATSLATLAPEPIIGPPLPPARGRTPSNRYGPKNGPVIFQFDPADGEAKGDFGEWLEKRVKEKIGEDGTNAQLFLETLRNNVPTMMLCCIPLFALVLKLLYIRQRRFYIEHLVYALHIHSFVYVAVVVITLVSMAMQQSLPALQPLLTFLLSVAVVALVFVSIRRVYGQGWLMTIVKFIIGGMVYFWVLAIALAATAMATLLLP